MSPAEVAWRVERRLALRRLARRAGAPVPTLPTPGAGFRATLVAATVPLVPWAGDNGIASEAERAAFEQAYPGEAARIVASAEAILVGRIELFARTYAFGPDPRAWPWNRSADDGPPVPLDFGPTLDYREPAVVGDARLAWELGRHGCLAPLAQAAWLTGDPRYARFAFAVIEAWSEACPPYRGIQWVSALEFAIRSLAWGFALAVVARSVAGAEIDETRWERVLATWAEQLRFVHAHDARFSSANNHRLGEAAGLAWGGIALSFLPEGDLWRRRGFDVLEECVLAQTTDDGVTREHAFAYQHFVLDFAVAVEAAGERTGRAMPAAVRSRLAAVASSLERFAPGGRLWSVGDGDEGQALALGDPFATRVTASLETARALVGDTGHGANHPRSFWLGLSPRAANDSTDAAGAFAPDLGVTQRGGYVLDAWDTPGGAARLLFDVAEMGLAPLYAHGHADALQVLLDVAGPRLVDPGTGAYHARPELREWLRSTAAHNTLELEGKSQSEPGGLFQWLRVARVTEIAVADGAALDASAAHDGYAKDDGLLHRRRVWRGSPTVVHVTDTLEAAGAGGTGGGAMRRAVVRWHVGEGRPRVTAPDRVEVTWPDGYVLALCVVSSPAGVRARIAEDGMWAPRFLEPRACGVVEWIVETAAGCTIETVIVLGGADFSFTAASS